MKKYIFSALIAVIMMSGCTQETQNKIGRSIQNWTGSHGILTMVSGGKIYARYFEIDKLSTAYGTSDGRPRNYRYGYGYLDQNGNGILDKNEKRKKVYFEIGSYDHYDFHDDPNQ